MLRNQLPNGVHDEFGVTAQLKDQIVNKIQQYFEQRGFSKVTTPVIEYLDVFDPYDVGQTKLYKFLAPNGNTVVLRPDLTLPVARVISSTNLNLPIKFYYTGDLFRINRELSGSQDETTQAGVELIGFSSIKAEQECLVMMIQLASKLQLSGFQIELGIARFARQILESLNLERNEVQQIETALFQKQITTYNELIEPFKQQKLYPFLQVWPRLFGPANQVIERLDQYELPSVLQPKINSLKKIVTWLQTDFKIKNIEIDLSSKAPQDYYTGLTFRAYSDQSGNYLFSGGRYDHLMAHFQADSIPAVGFGIDVDQLTAVQQSKVQPTQRTYLYFDDRHWQLAEKKLATLSNVSLCLADDLATAVEVVKQNNGQLLDLTKEDADGNTN
ncbi:ATP phosphoribosyltransferase regulatory subunit [Paucilactobacillus hokkaidonensis JCM 18461]|uniref:ATP phosphoribosyltransferase regulatory subunit n=2 Tax=Paucilactobacillus hokkaidonensis TaxID=1193095 RepID=A0A0A1H1T7_9LACO|nr:ATP phosphoribosyltransferase regulatory subunit [Paucilactobacillus hokkaidonensis]KRO09413.1 histidine--tRNA ligase [Paucilactobacillus hokkaidonensis]BAP86661.1 ATP phosphoribosyltransferase regulatory subunit [Paucilactobacillus hokkaidonensis JCM 18461]